MKNLRISVSHLTFRHIWTSKTYYSILCSPFRALSVTASLFFVLTPDFCYFLNKDELSYGDAYITLMAGICCSDCQHMIVYCFDQDWVSLLRSFKFCFLFKYKELWACYWAVVWFCLNMLKYLFYFSFEKILMWEGMYKSTAGIQQNLYLNIFISACFSNFYCFIMSQREPEEPSQTF